VTAHASIDSPFPTLTDIRPPNSQVAARLGEPIVIEGYNLAGLNHVVRFEHPLLATPMQVTPSGTPTETRLEVTLPSDAGAVAAWPAGLWSLSVSVQRPGEPAPRISNALPMPLAPSLQLAPGETTVTRNATTDAVTVHLLFRPQVWPGQRVSLQVGSREAPAPTITAKTGTIDFVFSQLESGPQWLRLRVDGVDSVLIDRASTPPRFAVGQQVTVPA
jgi:hypothetical protein